MKKILILITISLFSLCCNQKERIDNKNQIRIISLSPHITEIIYALEMDSNLVAVTDFCRYPPETQNKESIGGLLNPNIEKIIILKPTHLFGVLSHSNLNQELSKFSLKILMMPNETINDVIQTIKFISENLNITETGNRMIKSINDSLELLRAVNTINTKLKGMLIIGREKGSINNITVAGPNTFLHEIWNLVGGTNVFFDLDVKYSTVNLEEIIKRNPEIIIEFDMSSKQGLMRFDAGNEWNVLKDMKAVKENNMFVIGNDYSLIPGPRMVKLAKDFRRIFDLYRQSKNE